jgi:RNA polymerase sigma-70 factor, ECF subfamily
MVTKMQRRADGDRLDLLRRARTGDNQALDELLGAFRQYLVALARTQLTQRIQGKADASDLAQETLLEAHQHFGAFRGTSEAEFVSWLRTILSGLVANQVRRYLGTQRRNARLERPLATESPDRSSEVSHGLAANVDTPSQEAVDRESQKRLAAAMKQLPEHYRQVILLRHIEGRPFAEVAERMCRSVQGTEKLLMRALARLRRVMQE